MLNKIIFTFIATLMMLLTLLSATEAYSSYYDPSSYYNSNYNSDYSSPYFSPSSYSSYNPYSYSSYSYNTYNYPFLVYPDLYPVSTNYLYYDDDKYDNLPIVTGPFPRYYLFNTNADEDIDFAHDDFHHYDEFIGYKDLDVFYPSLGVVEVIRNENSRELDLSYLPEGYGTFGLHVYGYIPGPDGSCAMYRKHYMHEHPLELESYEYNYGYNYGYGYYTPFLAYRTTPAYTNSCQSITGCQYSYCSSCSA